MNNQLIANYPRLSVKITTGRTKILPHITGKLCTNISSLTTYTRLNCEQKDGACVKLFCTVMNKPMNKNHPRLYVNYSTSCKNPALFQIYTSTLMYKHTFKNNCTRHHIKVHPKRPVYTSSLLRLRTNIRTILICSGK